MKRKLFALSTLTLSLWHAHALAAHKIVLNKNHAEILATQQQTKSTVGLKSAFNSTATHNNILGSIVKTPKTSFKQLKKKSNFVTYQQQYQGLDLVGAQVTIRQDKAGQPQNFLGHLYDGFAEEIASTEQPTHFQLQDAKDWVLKTYLNSDDADNWVISEFTAKEVIYIDEQSKAHYAYQLHFLVDNKQASNPQKPVIYLDPESKVILHERDTLPHAYHTAGSGPRGNSLHGVSSYSVDDNINTASGPMTTFAVEYSSFWDTCEMTGGRNDYGIDTIHMKNAIDGENSPYEYACEGSSRENNHDPHTGLTNVFSGSPLNDAHYHGQLTFQLYKRLTGSGPLGNKVVKQKVHYGNNLDRAFWSGDTAYYGDGFFQYAPMVSLDIVAHEISHGYTDANSGLGSVGEAYAINESFSDMAAAAAEYYLTGQNDWLIGNHVILAGTAMRYFARPSLDGNSIESVNDYTTSLPQHYGAGIYNRAFYLLATSEGWNALAAFNLFRAANENCWNSSTTFASGAQCVMDSASHIASNPNALGKLGLSTAEIQADIYQAFANVDINTTPDSGLHANFSFDKEYNAQTNTFNKVRFSSSSLSLSNSNIIEYAWDFDSDGSIDSYLESPSHVFDTSNGNEFKVTLKVTDNRNNTSTYVRDRMIVNSDYCQVSASSSSNYWITNVVINGIDNPSGKQDQNFDPLSNPMPLYSNANTTLVLEPNDTSSNIKYWTVFVDYNHDGDFDDSGEKVLETNGSGTIDTGFAVPATSLSETTRMRVMMQWGQQPQDACSNLLGGEIEDYNVSFEDAPVVINPAFSFDSNLLTVTFKNDSTYSETPSWSWDFNDDGTPDSTQKNPTHTYPSSGTYYARLTATVGDVSRSTDRVKIVVSDKASNYCNPNLTHDNFKSHYHLRSLAINNVAENDDAAFGYQDKTYANGGRIINMPVTNTAQQTQYDASFSIACSAGNCSNYIVGWIDFNENNVFEDNEKVIDTQVANNVDKQIALSPVSGYADTLQTDTVKLTLPANTITSNDGISTRMRLAVRWTGNPEKTAPTACWNQDKTYQWFDTGEVEDHDVTIYQD